MICSADTVGVFQIESRAQMNMLPRLRPRCYYDLVIEVAIVRPGPIQGDMVHPYLRRRSGQEPVEYCHPAVERVLKKTLGVPLFQEQCMALAIHAAGFTPGEADHLRRAMAAWKRKGDQMVRFGAQLIKGMTDRGIPEAFARRCFDQIKGFSEYGFPESHAASFAHLVYASAYLKRHYPAHFACALLNSQPMGFYQPAQIVRDAIAHQVQVLPIDANFSTWDCRLEERATGRQSHEATKGQLADHHAADNAPREEPSVAASLRRSVASSPALRLGLRLASGLGEADARAIERATQRRPHAGLPPFQTPLDLWRASGCRLAALRALARADAFNSMNLPRQQALWAVQSISDEPMPLFEHARQDPADPDLEGPVPLPVVAPIDQTIDDYQATGLSLKAHPLSFLRDKLKAARAITCEQLTDPRRCPDKHPVKVAGLTLCRQRPSTASGIVFITLEDESGVCNLIVPPKVYQRYRREARHSAVMLASGRVERQGQVVHVKVKRLASLDGALARVAQRSRDFH
jgi:error-prone DNA polymerase